MLLCTSIRSGGGGGLDASDYFGEHLGDSHVLAAQFHTPGFDLGEIENVVDEREQMARAMLNVPDEALLLGGQRTRR